MFKRTTATTPNELTPAAIFALLSQPPRDLMADQWLNVAIYTAAIVGVGLIVLLVSYLLGPRKNKPGKLDPYECGVPMLSNTRERFSVHFYLVAILFILFDIETVFMVPYAVLYKKLGVPGLVEVGIFVAVLVYGLGYLWKRGALEWD
jgi:NADH-quinone oxidoreductase subunit A